MNYTNTSNIALALAVFLASDDYDYRPNTISVTTLMKSTRQVVLSKRINPSEAFLDISSLIPSRIGTAIHTGIEKAWASPGLKSVIKQLGYPEFVAQNIVVNPTKEYLAENPKAIPIYQEIRSEMELDGFIVTGKFDFVGEGIVQDFKTTSVYTYIYQSKVKDYITQMSLYRLLNPEIITKSYTIIHYVFTDWSKATAERTKGYPPSRIVAQKLELMSEEETKAFVKGKLAAIKMYKDAPEERIPLCNDEELWRKEATWKYYANPDKMGKSTKNFKTSSEAYARLAKDGAKGIVVHVPGQVIACNYCSAFSLCSQKDTLIANGELVI